MSGTRRGPRRPHRLGDGRVRAALCLGLVAGLWVTTSQAHWTDEAHVTGTSFTAGTLDLKVNNADSVASTTLSMTAMVPGDTTAQVLTVKNAGTAPLKYTLSGGLSGAGSTAFATAGGGALSLTIRSGGTASGSGVGATCSGGTSTYNQPLGASTSTQLLGRSGTLTAGAQESLCLQVTFAANAPSSLQGVSAVATFTAAATSDLS